MQPLGSLDVLLDERNPCVEPVDGAEHRAGARASHGGGVVQDGGDGPLALSGAGGVAAQIDSQLNSSSGNGLTVFAPTDNAFTSLASGTLNSLSDSQKNALVQYHVLSTAIPMSQFDTVSNPLRTQAGSSSPGEYPLNVTATGGQQVNISTGVVNATVDNTLYTGDQLVVYQVSKVLLPMAIAGTPAPAPAPGALAPKEKKAPTSSGADAPEADAATDVSLAAPARVITGGGVAVVHVLALLAWVWSGL